ncbi:MAG: hypothetical protein R3358_04935 [Woeseiaceae bacterium]|nr:hypothetical protein [Woeseiaceae bacterium]
MNKNFLISWVVVFIAWMAGSFLVHGFLLQSGYAALPNLFRTEAEAGQMFPLMLLGHVMLAGAFSWIYLRGKENKPWLPQGIRYGVAIAFLGPIPMYTIYYVVQPMPADFTIRQIVFDSILVIVLGVIVAFVNRDSAAPAAD